MGRDKALLEIDGEPLLSKVVRSLRTVCAEVLLVGGDPARFEQLDLPARWIADPVADKGPLAGILAALEAAAPNRVLVVGCDMPFVSTGVVAALAEAPHDCLAFAYPSGDGLEPLLAVYTPECREPLRAALAVDDLSARRFLERVGARPLPPDVVDRLDPEHRAATNLNTPDDIERLLAGDRRRPGEAGRAGGA